MLERSAETGFYFIDTSFLAHLIVTKQLLLEEFNSLLQGFQVVLQNIEHFICINLEIVVCHDVSAPMTFFHSTAGYVGSNSLLVSLSSVFTASPKAMSTMQAASSFSMPKGDRRKSLAVRIYTVRSCSRVMAVSIFFSVS